MHLRDVVTAIKEKLSCCLGHPHPILEHPSPMPYAVRFVPGQGVVFDDGVHDQFEDHGDYSLTDLRWRHSAISYTWRMALSHLSLMVSVA